MIRLILLLLCLSSLNSYSSERVIAPFPFYTADTRAGLSLKYIEKFNPTHTLDVLFYGTQNKQYAAITSYKYSPKDYTLTLSNLLMDSHVDYYGIGNELPKDPIGEYTRFRFSPEVDLEVPTFFQNFSLVTGLRYNDTVFTQLNNFGMEDDKSFHMESVQGGLGVKYKIKREEKDKLELSAINSSSIDPLSNADFNYLVLRLKNWNYLTEKFHHAMMVDYRNKTNKQFRYDTEKSDIRGISDNRLNDRIAFKIANELHYSLLEYLDTVFLVDAGRVFSHLTRENMFKNYHFGVGAGIRYKIKKLAVVRFDYARSKGGESSISFNFGPSI